MLDFIKEFLHQLRLSCNLYYANDVIYMDHFLMLSRLSFLKRTQLGCVSSSCYLFTYPSHNVFSKLL